MLKKIVSLSFVVTMLLGMNAPAFSAHGLTIASALEDTVAPSTPSNFTLYAVDAYNRVFVKWSASSDNVGVFVYQVSIDGSGYAGIGTVLSFETNSLVSGSHIISVRAQDEAGNVSGSALIHFSMNDQGQIPELMISTSDILLESVFADAILIMEKSRGDLEVVNGRMCELAPEDASSRISVTLNNIPDTAIRTSIENFTACGTPASLRHGAGERLGIINSYLAAFGQLPSTREQWYDVLKIGNGRFTGEVSTSSEIRAKTNFHLVYLREANMNVTGDYNAIMVMAYGLRPLPRNMSSETSAIVTFLSVYNRAPWSAGDWDIVRAVAYSGAKR